MRNNLGSLLLWVALLLNTLYAHDGFTTKFTLDKETPYLKEAVVMQLDIEQTDHSKVMLFKFSPKQSDRYEFHRLDIQKEDSYHAAKIHYSYLIYPLQAGKVEIEFDLLEMITTDEKVAFSFSGDRDNTRGLHTTDVPITLAPLTLNVKALPKGTQLVGDFKLSYDIKKESADAYEPLPIKITIKGEGYPPLLHTLIPQEPKKYSIFAGKVKVKSLKSTQGNRSEVHYPFALSAKESFTLDTINLQAFDPKRAVAYRLTIPKQHFTIKQPDRETLLDKYDSPKRLQSDWGWLFTFMSYVVVFIAGFLSAKSLKYSLKLKHSEVKDAFFTQVEHTKTHKELLALLLATDSQRYEHAIELLEQSIYNKKKISLEKIKKELLQ